MKTILLVAGMLGCAGTFFYHVLAEQKQILAAAEALLPVAKKKPEVKRVIDKTEIHDEDFKEVEVPIDM